MDPFVAEVRMFGFRFAPSGWAFCDGQVIPLRQNTALFSLLGTTYGGDGSTTFALPNLTGAVPMMPGQGPGLSLHDLGEMSGSPTVTLLQQEMPSHTHFVQGDNDAFNATTTSANGALPCNPAPTTIYSTSGSPARQNMSFLMAGISGGDQPHNNLMPYLVVNFCIALQGVMPSRQ